METSTGFSDFLSRIRNEIEIDELSKDFELVLDDIPITTNSNAEGPFSFPFKRFRQMEKRKLSKYSQCWPKDWLAKDCRNVRIIGVNYNTSLSMWASICPSEKTKFTLDDHSDLLLEKFIQAGVGKKPIVWITHSMGGLIVKNMLQKGNLTFFWSLSFKIPVVNAIYFQHLIRRMTIKKIFALTLKV